MPDDCARNRPLRVDALVGANNPRVYIFPHFSRLFVNGELKTVAAAVPPKAKTLTHHFHLFRRLDKAIEVNDDA
jgi:hypothetical protein